MADARSIAASVFWAATWGVGVAIGVALGGWLTVVGGAGTPGADSLDLAEDVIMLPVAVGLIVFVLHLLAQAVWGFVRSDAPARKDDRDDHAREYREQQDVEGDIRPEVEAPRDGADDVGDGHDRDRRP